MKWVWVKHVFYTPMFNKSNLGIPSLVYFDTPIIQHEKNNFFFAFNLIP